jgi:hypothetical protein
MTATNTTVDYQPPAMTQQEQAWLDACPHGESRSLGKCGQTFTVDRRMSFGTGQAWPHPWVNPYQPGWHPFDVICSDSIYIGTPPPGSETVTSSIVSTN